MFDWSCYGQQEVTLRCVAGPMGYASITLDAVTIEQLIAVPDKSSFPAQGLANQSGILGMGHIRMTNAFNTSAGLGEAPEGQIVYSPFAQTLFASNTTPPLESALFTLAISRDASNNGSGGIFTIGGLPDNRSAVNITSDNSTTAPWEFMTSMSGVPDDEFTFYSIIVDGFDVDGQLEAVGLQIIIDSGANTIELPADLANSLNQQWVPSSPDGNGATGLDCNAVLPWPFGIQIGGKTYYSDSNQYCRSGIFGWRPVLEECACGF
ncbi:aspartic peptidase domain-containing protein [Exophiala viscosa]|uniref:aspartic peptidase domain-containing protein n=1 Tax=Exophiala viscosa TaxID=2486360 RepID=UPI0021943074|nr:aspartic peptidase domain-containing protein [Exophiala viscosa]